MEEPNNSVKYKNGKKAFSFLEDKSGFVYYPSGRTAVCVSNVNSYQNKYYCYDDDRSNTLVAAIDEHGCGFATDNSGGEEHGKRLVLTKTGGLLSAGNGDIIAEWRWDPSAPGAAAPPASVSLTLCEALQLDFGGSPRALGLAFAHREGARLRLDAGARVRREGTYLEGATRAPGGKLEPALAARATLVQRAAAANERLRAKRALLNPSSKNLEMAETKAMVAGLEGHFDGYGAGDSRAVPYIQDGWRQEALAATLSELPPIARAGTEKGDVQGFGTTLYGPLGSTAPQPERLAATQRATAALRRGDGAWKGSLDVRRALMGRNPPLARSRVLNEASGRYQAEIRVPGGARSEANPTGKTENPGRRLPRIRGRELRAWLAARARPDQLAVVYCGRADNSECRKAEAVVERVHAAVLAAAAAPGAGGRPSVRELRGGGGGSGGGGGGAAGGEGDGDFVMGQVEMAQDEAFGRQFKVKSVPAFLMFYNGQLVYKGSLGGLRAKALPAHHHRPRTLLVEPCFRAQLQAEKLLKANKFAWDLALTGAAAAAAQARALQPGGGGGYELVLASDKLEGPDCRALERAFKNDRGGNGGGRRRRGGAGATDEEEEGALLVGMVEAKGEDGAAMLAEATWEHGVTKDCASILPPEVASIVTHAITKPVKAAVLEVLDKLSKGAHLSEDAMESKKPRFKGLTTVSLMQKMKDSLDKGQRGVFLQEDNPEDHGIELSATETIYKGTVLQKTSLLQVDNGGF